MKKKMTWLILLMLVFAISVTPVLANEKVTVSEKGDLIKSSLDSYNIKRPALVSVKNVYGGVQFNWRHSTGAVKYRVFRKTGNSGWKKLADTSMSTYTDKNVKSGVKYVYTVRCINAKGTAYTSGYDTSGKAITYVAPPALPTLKNVTNGVQISWSRVAGAAKYRVFRKSGSSGWTKITDTTGVSYTDKNVKSGTRYTYTIRCISNSGSYTSAYNTTGKAITYTGKKYDVYKTFLEKGTAAIPQQGSSASTYTIKLDKYLLFDINQDGIKELIVFQNNLGTMQGRYSYFVFGIKNGSVYYVGVAYGYYNGFMYHNGQKAFYYDGWTNGVGGVWVRLDGMKNGSIELFRMAWEGQRSMYDFTKTYYTTDFNGPRTEVGKTIYDNYVKKYFNKSDIKTYSLKANTSANRNSDF